MGSASSPVLIPPVQEPAATSSSLSVIQTHVSLTAEPSDLHVSTTVTHMCPTLVHVVSPDDLPYVYPGLPEILGRLRDSLYDYPPPHTYTIRPIMGLHKQS